MDKRQKALNFLGLIKKAGKLVSGTETVLLGIKAQKVKLVVIASDCQANTLEKVERACRLNHLELVQTFTAAEIGHAIGQKRKVLGILDQGFSLALMKKIKEGV
ncbi:L7Ae/L30e/S12e/Gadd45 family ribosomal protein [Lactobacillus corticis]|uniref:50S ribosomal protein L7ae n=1 Tax=Lactobacillus corticis TaxID=2201249 RepID=A0A916VHZ2_9LACO|nr:ribosomal L7Ae/L30e/S12e/Gadd45 family protein [Lactobacillus corticis]GFZ27197.1 50S ribosomal protein L7ae [Lactobacillus corticis]